MNSNTFPFHILYFVFLLCSFSQCIQISAIVGNETDLQSLIAFKNGVEGLSSWNQSFHFCQWEGIACGKLHQRVITLNLSSQNLVGKLSPHIGNLSFLRFINLENNRFYGQIPPDLDRLSRLQHLKMSNNSFVGNIPVNLSHCTNLRIIDLRWNNLSGNIPAQLGSLSKLEVLALYRNTLKGELPSSLGNLSSLEVLNVGQNNLEGSIPHTFGKLSKLYIFFVELNKFSGMVPLSLYNLSFMTDFSIAFNQFTGSLPRDIGTTLPSLIQFLASTNQLSGTIPNSIANASNIQKFDLSTNNFSGKVPHTYGGLQHLYWLNLASNHLGRGEDNDLSFITSLTNASSLETLILNSNVLGGFIPDSVANLSFQMTMLYLGDNEISGIIPEGIENLVYLIGLGLESNYFHGSIPSSIGYLHRLQLLPLWGNKLTGSIPSSIANATQLYQLDLSSNRLHGSVPSSLGGFQFLQLLDLSQNNLSGAIPKQIFSMSSLSNLLNLSHNSFTGSLPTEIGKLGNLVLLDVSGNKLSGEIPSSLSSCLSLDELHLEKNLFEGKIPQSLSSLKGISYIDLSSNNLSGPIPKYLQSLGNLQILNLSFNKLDGEVPRNGVFKNKNLTFLNGNYKLCGGNRELGLPTCQIKGSKKQKKTFAFRLAIVFSVVSLFLLASGVLVFFWKRKEKTRSSFSSTNNQYIKVSYRDLFQATNGFSPTNFVGSGSFGHVYKGMLNQDEVAVKVFNIKQKGSSKIFVDECESLRNIRHRNLVKVLTSCSSMDFQGNDFKALVFEFMQNGSLDEWLHREGDEQEAPSRNLNLIQRLNIAIDVATGLQYLHHECHVSIVHRDLKPSNILLDKDMVAHVGDFGLAKLLLRPGEGFDASLSTSAFVKGTIGYTAPEYGMGIAASIQADVYSYGILLLEMFTGRRPTDELFKDGLEIHTYARDALMDTVTQVLDPILLSEEEEILGSSNSTDAWNQKGHELLDCITEVIRIGVACSVESPAKRIDMRDVNRELVFVRESIFGTYAWRHKEP